LPKPPKAAHTGETKSRGEQHYVGKLRLYEILHNLNQGFEQVRGQLQILEKLGLGNQPWKDFRVIAEENRAEINFGLVERLAEREERTGRTLAGFATSGRRSFEIRYMC
jgi:hypothetical protein